METQPEFAVGEELLAHWVEYSLNRPESEWVAVTPSMNLGPLRASEAGMGFFLRLEFDPYKTKAPVDWTAHAAKAGGIDLLHANWTVNDVNLALWEGRNFIIIGAELSGSPLPDANDKERYIIALLHKVLCESPEVQTKQFVFPGDFNIHFDDRHIVSQRSRSIYGLVTRHDRIDILTKNQKAYFIFFKKIAQLMNYPPDDEWFPAEARQIFSR